MSAELAAHVAVVLSGDWRDFAACRGQGVERFVFVLQGGQAKMATAEAAKTCEPCPVRTECVAFALTLGTGPVRSVEPRPGCGRAFGVWGGWSMSHKPSRYRAEAWLESVAPGLLAAVAAERARIERGEIEHEPLTTCQGQELECRGNRIDDRSEGDCDASDDYYGSWLDDLEGPHFGRSTHGRGVKGNRTSERVRDVRKRANAARGAGTP